LNLPHVCFIAVHIYPVLAGHRGIAFVGGAEVQQSVQMRALLRAGCRISVLTKDHGQPDVVDCDGITVYKIPDSGQRGWPGLRFFHPRMSDLVRLLWRISPDIVFMQTAGEQVASAAVYARTSGRPFVFAGASDKDFVMGPLPGMPAQHTAMYRWGLRAAEAVVVQNVAQLELLKRHFRRNGHLIQNGYEEPQAQPGDFDGNVLWAATVKPLKRPDLVLALARRLRHLRFLMVGGPGVDRGAQAYFDGIAHQARGLSNLTMTGHVPFRDVGLAFDGASVCLNTSDYEGLPNTFMQAWLRGIPTLSFVRPESAPGVSGTLACDDVDHMALRLDRLTRDRSAWSAASQACRRHFEDHHTMDVAVARYLEVFDQVLRGRRATVAVPPRLGERT
jgi:glycosyltransferase involved in cell wall biosynthesis